MVFFFWKEWYGETCILVNVSKALRFHENDIVITTCISDFWSLCDVFFITLHTYFIIYVRNIAILESSYEE